MECPAPLLLGKEKKAQIKKHHWTFGDRIKKLFFAKSVPKDETIQYLPERKRGQKVADVIKIP